MLGLQGRAHFSGHLGGEGPCFFELPEHLARAGFPFCILFDNGGPFLDLGPGKRNILRVHFFYVALGTRVNRSADQGREARFRFSDDRSPFLGLSVVFLLVVMPLLEREAQSFVPFLFLLVMAVVLWPLGLAKVLFGLCVVLGLLGFGFSLWLELRAVSEAVSEGVALALLGVYASFYGICLVVFLDRIFSEKMIAADPIQGELPSDFSAGCCGRFSIPSCSCSTPLRFHCRFTHRASFQS